MVGGIDSDSGSGDDGGDDDDVDVDDALNESEIGYSIKFLLHVLFKELKGIHELIDINDAAK